MDNTVEINIARNFFFYGISIEIGKQMYGRFVGGWLNGVSRRISFLFKWLGSIYAKMVLNLTIIKNQLH